MLLKDYTNALPTGGVSALAATLGITPVYISQLSARQDGREPGPELCVRIEAATNCAVRRWDLRPNDWPRIWPELIGAPGAPAIVEPARESA